MTKTQSSINNLEQIEDLINNPDPIAADDPAYEQIFKDLQGRVIKNYGRQHSLYIFIQFDKNKINEVKQWIRAEIATNVTSTWGQLEDTKTYRARQQDSIYVGKLCQNFFLSDRGYLALGFNTANANNKGEKIDDSLFKQGMRKHWEDTYLLNKNRDDYWYNPPERWDLGGNDDKQIHALMFLAHSSLEELKNEAKTIIDRGEKLGKIVACEVGSVFRDGNDKAIGPFGFADGISQPLFLKRDYDKYCQNQDIKQWNPFASLNLVLVKDPYGESYSYGSYCVFQKLETNYELFAEKIGELAEKIEGDRDRAEALVVGRFKDGTPIALAEQPNQNDKNPIANSFNYTDDLYGRKCPLHSHIRKVNPRQDRDDADLAEARKKNRIFRAGITYFDDPKAWQTQDLSVLQQCLNKLEYFNEISQQSLEKNIASISGLLFVCFQQSISEQFDRLQRKWADDSEFPREREDGKTKYLDPIIGHRFNRNRQEQSPEPQEWQKKWNGEEFSRYLFDGCIKEKGGEFLFMPSISFLKSL